MLNSDHASHPIFVLDQDEALDFYVGKLGLEVRTDVDLGFMRWLTVGVPGDAGPRDPARDARPAGDGRGHRRAGPRAGHQGRDRRLDRLHHRRLPQDLRDAASRKGVEFTEEPTERSYGIDCGLRDPFGNAIRISQPTAAPPAG